MIVLMSKHNNLARLKDKEDRITSKLKSYVKNFITHNAMSWRALGGFDNLNLQTSLFKDTNGEVKSFSITFNQYNLIIKFPVKDDIIPFAYIYNIYYVPDVSRS